MEEGQNLLQVCSILLTRLPSVLTFCCPSGYTNRQNSSRGETSGNQEQPDSAMPVALLLATHETGSLTPKATRSKQLRIPIHTMHLTTRSTPSSAVPGGIREPKPIPSLQSLSLASPHCQSISPGTDSNPFFFPSSSNPPPP